MSKPITWKEYKSKPEKFWKGKKVKALVGFSNYYFEVEPGAVFVIKRKYKGFDLIKFEPCEVCKTKRILQVSRVGPTALELLS